MAFKFLPALLGDTVEFKPGVEITGTVKAMYSDGTIDLEMHIVYPGGKVSPLSIFYSRVPTEAFDLAFRRVQK
jgi:hypothetical protein